jgi:hypothetical protein
MMEWPAGAWQPSAATQERIAALIPVYREAAQQTLAPLIRGYYPAMQHDHPNEYRKMLELSTKMILVGHACTEILAYPFDERRRTISALYGGCCFLADSFVDDFGDEAARDYLERFGRLLREGWFEPRTERERLFYVVVSRLFGERDVLEPVLRQAIGLLYRAQEQDVTLRFADAPVRRRAHLARLKDCARNRSGHAIIVLATFLVPEIGLRELSLIFSAGALIMHIDDHGDCYADRRERRFTFMNQLRRPERALKRLFVAHVKRLFDGMPAGSGRDLMIGFLTRYYVTRVAKHRQQRREGGYAWAVYE